MPTNPSDRAPEGAQELKPCPFCGGSNIIADVYIRDGREVGCRDCGASCHAFNPDAGSRAISKWNTRISPESAPPSQRTTEA